MTNAARGEIEVCVGNQNLVICITPDSLCRYSSSIGAQSFAECMRRASAAEPVAIVEAVRYFTVEGDAKLAIEGIELRQFPEIGARVLDAFTVHLGDDNPGKEDGGAPTT